MGALGHEPSHAPWTIYGSNVSFQTIYVLQFSVNFGDFDFGFVFLGFEMAKIK